MSERGWGRGDRWVRVVPAAYSALLTLVIAGPLLGTGYLLLRDAVSTPRSYLTDAALGLGDAAPRAVPQDALLAALSPVIDGGLLVKAILLAALWAAGYGAAVLSRTLLGVPVAAQLVAVTVAIWNPFVAERLLQGHWSLLTGYAALPWTALAAHRLRERANRNAVSAPHRRRPDPTPSRTARPEQATEAHDQTTTGPRSLAATPEGRAAPVHPSLDRTASSQTAPDQIGSGPTGSDRTAANRTPPEQTNSDQPGSNQTTTDQTSPSRMHPGQAGSRPHVPSEPSEPEPVTRVADRRPGQAVRDWAALAGCFAAAGLTPTGALLAGIVGLVVAGRRNVAGALALLIAASAPWLVATLASGAGTETSDPAGIAAFAARAEPGLATIGSLAGLGGIWNADAVPWSRTTPLALAATAILLILVALGVRTVAGFPVRRIRPGASRAHQTAEDPVGQQPDTADVRTGRRLLGLALAAVLLPALGATAWGMEVLEWLVVEVPGAGLLRDTQKYVALAMPAYALCVAAGCAAVAARFGGRAIDRSAGPDATATTAETEVRSADSVGGASAHTPNDPTSNPISSTAEPGSSSTTPGHTSTLADAGSIDAQPGSSGADGPGRSRVAPPTHDRRSAAGPALTTIAALFIAALILPLIDLAWGVGGEMRAVRYPAAWQQVAERVDGPGDVAVLPGGMFRRFPYSGPAPVLDPAPRMLPNDVLQTGELPVRGQRVSGEGARAGQVESLLLTGGTAKDLAALGVGWVLVEHRTPGPLGESKTTLAQLEPMLTTPDLSLYRVPGVITERTAAHRPLVISAHLLWASLLFAPLLTIRPLTRRRIRERSTPAQ
ncbi:hypothetical protein [Nocardia cyriacigeorgica]|uniref:hypothetical protein n=1 Tax=Nocardia cyriacigeorgica TaxID=135487 RepID=UPI003D7A79AA